MPHWLSCLAMQHAANYIDKLHVGAIGPAACPAAAVVLQFLLLLFANCLSRMLNKQTTLATAKENTIWILIKCSLTFCGRTSPYNVHCKVFSHLPTILSVFFIFLSKDFFLFCLHRCYMTFIDILCKRSVNSI